MRIFYLLLLVYCVGCNSTPNGNSLVQISLQDSTVLDSLPSGSGLVFTNSNIIVVSDNMNGFFILDSSSLQHSFVAFDSTAAHIQNKDIKQDFESATSFRYKGAQWIIAFGSGSMENTREKILMIPVDNPPHFNSSPATGFYNVLKKQMGISTASLNIEACFATDDSIYLLNRGTNHSIAIGLSDMTNSIRSDFKQVPPMRIRKFVLPIIDGFTASFSGACFFKKDQFLFSATVEKTSNWVDDGEVAGSFIGLANIDGTVLQVVPLKTKDNKMVMEKIESIEWVKLPNDQSLIYAISDNDNGKSTWFVLKANGLL